MHQCHWNYPLCATRFKTAFKMNSLGLLWLFLMLILASNPVFAKKPPKLILQITVDQLRADLPYRYMDRFTDSGFKYLYTKGIVFKNAHHPHANTETIVGHTTLATGTTPAIHGMVGNIWYDRKTGETVYNIEDPDYHLLTQGADVDESKEIDHTQKAAKTDGRSPTSILVSTFSDELRSFTNGRSKVVGVSIKDRGAVAMAGHSGKAFWFSKSKGEFVTSSYYYHQYPEWVEDWNRQKKPEQYANTHWELLHPKESYLFKDSDDRISETQLGKFGNTFPHPYGSKNSKLYNTLLTVSPAGDALVFDFAKTALLTEQLGKDEITDFLSVSLSSTDYVGHLFGPSSLEAEDNLLRLDQQLSQFLEFIDEQVDLDDTLIVLSADHGASDSPEYLTSLNIPASYALPDLWEKDQAIRDIKNRFNIKGKLIERFVNPYIYLTDQVRNAQDIDQQALEQAIVKEVVKFKGVSSAVSSQSLMTMSAGHTFVQQAVLDNFHPQRSGDIYIIFEPHNFINQFSGLTVASTHGSPWRYDTHVPIVFAGYDLDAQQVYRKVSTTDIASTLSSLMNCKLPSGAIGDVLVEVFH